MDVLVNAWVGWMHACMDGGISGWMIGWVVGLADLFLGMTQDKVQ